MRFNPNPELQAQYEDSQKMNKPLRVEKLPDNALHGDVFIMINDAGDDELYVFEGHDKAFINVSQASRIAKLEQRVSALENA